MEIKPEFKPKSIRSFVIRAGRMTDGQRGAFAAHWPHYGLSLFDGPLIPRVVFGNDHPLVAEVGFGMGDSLLAMAKAEPGLNFVGIEVHPPGVGRLINSAAKEEVRNLRVFMADAKDVLIDCIPDSSLARFQLYFPDPWHKKKHHKRRIVQPEFIALIASKLQPGGLLHMATDWREYAEHMLEVVRAEPQLVNTAEDFAPRPEFRPITKFEMRGERLGHGVWDLLLRKRE
jgi:tRNA (guanine-N7-)-methyltransferase